MKCLPPQAKMIPNQPERLLGKDTNYLKENGVFATPVLPPAVPKGEALIRTSYMASHSSEELTKVLEVLAKAKKEFEIPGTFQ